MQHRSMATRRDTNDVFPSNANANPNAEFSNSILIGVVAAVPSVFAVVLIVVLIVTWVVPRCSGRSECRQQHRNRRLQELEKVVKPELFMEWAKREKKKRPEREYDNALCVICLDQFEDDSQIRGLGCHHIFHQNCLDDWFSRYNEFCPLCHRPIIPGRVSQMCDGVERPIFSFVV